MRSTSDFATQSATSTALDIPREDRDSDNSGQPTNLYKRFIELRNSIETNGDVDTFEEKYSLFKTCCDQFRLNLMQLEPIECNALPIECDALQDHSYCKTPSTLPVEDDSNNSSFDTPESIIATLPVEDDSNNISYRTPESIIATLLFQENESFDYLREEYKENGKEFEFPGCFLNICACVHMIVDKKIICKEVLEMFEENSDDWFTQKAQGDVYCEMFKLSLNSIKLKHNCENEERDEERDEEKDERKNELIAKIAQALVNPESEEDFKELLRKYFDNFEDPDSSENFRENLRKYLESPESLENFRVRLREDFEDPYWIYILIKSSEEVKQAGGYLSKEINETYDLGMYEQFKLIESIQSAYFKYLLPKLTPNNTRWLSIAAEDIANHIIKTKNDEITDDDLDKSANSLNNSYGIDRYFYFEFLVLISRDIKDEDIPKLLKEAIKIAPTKIQQNFLISVYSNIKPRRR